MISALRFNVSGVRLSISIFSAGLYRSRTTSSPLTKSGKVPTFEMKGSMTMRGFTLTSADFTINDEMDMSISAEISFGIAATVAPKSDSTAFTSKAPNFTSSFSTILCCDGRNP